MGDRDAFPAMRDLVTCAVPTKTCTRCGDAKPTDAFARRGAKGRASWCLACFYVWRRVYRAARRSGRKPGQQPKLVVAGLLTCGRCKIPKPTSCFFRDAAKASGFQSRCKECNRAAQRATWHRQKARRLPKARAYVKARCEVDPQFKLSLRLRARLADALRNQINGSCVGKRGASAVRDLGCTIPELMTWLEIQFVPGMSWSNYGAWHIDHVTAMIRFDLTDPSQCRAACHFTNLQPLWASENQSKGARA